MCDTNGNIACGDCSDPDPEWASLNRGLLLCKDCCYVHRTLGPQFTRVKSLKHSNWHPNLKKLVYSLATGPANHVWEYTLLIEPTKADLNLKPSPSDSLETKKRKFITAKHLMCQFVRRQKSDSVSNELHSTVRTSDIGTSLRLLTAGGDPNFFHPVQGTRPLHVAARHGQGLQVELLFLHGAQTDGLDYLGQTPVEHALAAGHKDLALRLLELRYFLTDALTYFVCSEVPDHSTTKHIIIPRESIVGPNRMRQEQLLRSQGPHVLEQFTADLYDELDRRELEAAMLQNLTGLEASKYSVAFLPVHSYFPSVRNQTRQKFARLTTEELASLITLVLMESKRRHCNNMATNVGTDRDIFIHLDSRDVRSSPTNGTNVAPLSTKPSLIEDDEFPLYDNVADDDDLILTEEQTLLSRQGSAIEVSQISNSNVNPVSKYDSQEEARRSLKLDELLQSNETMKTEINVLQKMIELVIGENLELRKSCSKIFSSQYSTAHSSMANGLHSSIRRHNPPMEPVQLLKSKPPRPVSMCDTKTEKLDSIGNRSSSTEICRLRKDDCPGKNGVSSSDLVQETTIKVVELIKVLIEQANANDLNQIQFTCFRIHGVVQDMAQCLIQDQENTGIQDVLQHVLFQVVRMKSEIDILVSSKIENGDKGKEGFSSAADFVQRVNRICFDVGAAMKLLVSMVITAA